MTDYRVEYNHDLMKDLQRYEDDAALLRVLTPEKVALWVQELNLLKGDEEVAHGREDDIHEIVLRAVAVGNPRPKELAEEALASRMIDFDRWYA